MNRITALVVGGAAMIALLGLVGGSPTVTIVGPVVVAVTERERRLRSRRRLRRDRRQQLPHLIDALLQEVRSGRSLATASGTVLTGPWAPLVNVGSSADLDPPLRLIAVTLRVLRANGGPALPALRRLRHTLMGLVHAEQQAWAESSQALASAGTLTAAPALFALVAAMADPRLARFYLFEALGTVVVSVTVLLSYAGWRWIDRIVAAATETAGIDEKW